MAVIGSMFTQLLCSCFTAWLDVLVSVRLVTSHENQRLQCSVSFFVQASDAQIVPTLGCGCGERVDRLFTGCGESRCAADEQCVCLAVIK